MVKGNDCGDTMVGLSSKKYSKNSDFSREDRGGVLGSSGDIMEVMGTEYREQPLVVQWYQVQPVTDREIRTPTSTSRAPTPWAVPSHLSSQHPRVAAMSQAWPAFCSSVASKKETKSSSMQCLHRNNPFRNNGHGSRPIAEHLSTFTRWMLMFTSHELSVTILLNRKDKSFYCLQSGPGILNVRINTDA